jgi:hypothetical protein
LKDYPCYDPKACSEPDDKVKKEATSFKNPPLSDAWDNKTSDSEKSDRTLRYVLNKHPVVACFLAKPPGFSAKHWIPAPVHPDTPGHAMVVVGFKQGKDGQSKTGYFILLNSYGPKAHWNGFISIGYQDFGRFAEEGLVLSDPAYEKGDDSSNILFDYADFKGSMTISLEKKNLWLEFDDAASQYKSKEIFTLTDGAFWLGFDVPAGNCAYLLYLPPRGSARLLEASEWSLNDWEAVAPPLRWHRFDLRLPDAGDNTLVLLQSMYPIENIEARVWALGISGPARLRLEKAFGNLLLNQSETWFDKHEMTFRPKKESGSGMAVPLIFFWTLRR